MNRIVVIAFLTCLMLAFQDCTRTAVKPEDNTGPCSPKHPDEKVTYNGYAKKILNTYCITCHYGSGIGPGDFRTYQGVLPYTGAFKIRVLSDNADMPQGNAPLPKSIRDSLAIWIENCAPEN